MTNRMNVLLTLQTIWNYFYPCLLELHLFPFFPFNSLPFEQKTFRNNSATAYGPCFLTSTSLLSQLKHRGCKQLPPACPAATLLTFPINTCLYCCQYRNPIITTVEQPFHSFCGSLHSPLQTLGCAFSAYLCTFPPFALDWYLGCTGLEKEDLLRVDREKCSLS